MSPSPPRRRLAVLTPYAVAPPRHGPQIRIAGLLGNLDPSWEIRHFSQAIQRTDLPRPQRRLQAGPRWTEQRLLDPLSNAWLVGLSKIAHFPAVYADRLLGLAPRLPIREALRSADAVLVSPHYQFRWARRHTPPGTPVVVDCHCIEADVWQPRGSWFTQRLNDEIRRGELEAWRGADCVFATCDGEADYIRSLGAREVVVVPNATDVDRIKPASSDAERRSERVRLGLPADGMLAVFVGSSGWANVEAADILVREAPKLQAIGVQTVVAGRVGIGRPPATGIHWAGEVEDVAPWLRAADLALCPLQNGSGTSLKVVEYLAAGLPLVTTPVGARGLAMTDGRHALFAEPEEFPAAVRRLVDDPQLSRRLAAAARTHAVERFSWRAAAGTASTVFQRLAAAGADLRAAVPAR